jgi:hypothetical protein
MAPDIRFRLGAAFGGIGVVLEILDAHTRERRRGIKRLLLRAENVRALQKKPPPPPDQRTPKHPGGREPVYGQDLRNTVRSFILNRLNENGLPSSVNKLAEEAATWYQNQLEQEAPVPGSTWFRDLVKSCIDDFQGS